MLEMYEVGKPWIIWRYIRSDFWAMILGGLIEGQCLICGHVEKLKLGRWGIWFPPKNPQHRHPKRDIFIFEHLHTEVKENRLLWARPLKNIGVANKDYN